jgi:hypothetical protein
MPVLFQLRKTSSFTLLAARYRHVALGFRSGAHCDVFAREDCKCHAGETEEQCEQRTEVNETAFTEPLPSRRRGITASEEVMAGICGARGGFLFHYWNLGLCEAHSRGVEMLVGPALRGVNALDSGDLKMQEKPF